MQSVPGPRADPGAFAFTIFAAPAARSRYDRRQHEGTHGANGPPVARAVLGYQTATQERERLIARKLRGTIGSKRSTAARPDGLRFAFVRSARYPPSEIDSEAELLAR
jgi:hypothetical protein